MSSNTNISENLKEYSISLIAGLNEEYKYPDKVTVTLLNIKYDTYNDNENKTEHKEIENTDIYEYNLQSEKSDNKKHLGFVIGKDRKYSKKIVALDDKGKEIGVDNYSMTSLCLQAIKEQQEQINSLKEEIKKLKESDK